MGALVERKESAVMSLEDMGKQADILISSKILPSNSTTREEIIAKTLIGQEYGIPMMQAQKEVYTFKGSGGGTETMVKAERILQLCLERIPGFAYNTLVDTEKEVSVEFMRNMNGNNVKRVITSKVTDKSVVHLLGKNNWKYANLMLWYTVCRAMGRTFAPDYKSIIEPRLANINVATTAMEELTNVTPNEERETVQHTTTDGKTVEVNGNGEVLDAEVVPDTKEDDGYDEELEQQLIDEEQQSQAQPEEGTGSYPMRCHHEACGVDLAQDVYEYSIKNFRKPYCREHQKDH